MARRDVGWLALIVASFLLFGGLFALYMRPWDAEWGFVVLGPMLWRGEIRLFQDEIVGQRLPLPFYIIGLSQLVAGPSLVAARLTSVALGGVAIVLTFFFGRILGGRACGFVAALFLVTHGLVVGYYAAASYYSLASVLIVAGLLAIVRLPAPTGPLLGMACFSVLSLTRTHLAVMTPAVLVYLLAQSSSRARRLALLAITAFPPLLFLVWSPEHLKILAYVPGVARLVEPLGYRSLLAVGGEALIPERPWQDGIVWFVRRHFFWVASSVALAAAWLLSRRARSAPPSDVHHTRRFVVFIAALAVYTLALQAVILHMYLKSVAAWASAFAPLWALVLGYGAAKRLTEDATPRVVRYAVAAVLLGVFAFSPTFSRHTAMPKPLPPRTTTALLDADADVLRARIPVGARVFLLGSPIPAHLARVSPYLQQIMHNWTLVPSQDDFAVRRSGLWGPRQIDEWLGHGARYALVEPDVLANLEKIEAYAALARQMQTLLDRHFVLDTTAGSTPWTPVLRVYARRSPASG